MNRSDREAATVAFERARLAAFPPGEFVGQESFMRATEIRSLAHAAGITSDDSVLDLCCGVAGPGRLIAAELGCTYLGVDASAEAVELARRAAGDLPCTFEVSQVPPLPAGRFDVVLLLETMLAFPDKPELLHHVSSALPTGGRFALTVEEGRPLTPAERAVMPEADTVWPIPLPELLADLELVGLEVTWVVDCSASHRITADALADAFVAERETIAARVGHRAVDELVTGHRLWSDWLGSGRARKLALVAEKTRVPAPHGEPVGGAVRSPW